MIKVVWPERISLKYWAACLNSNFESENLPNLEDDTQWAEWATIVANTGIFLRAGVPSPITIKSGEKQENFKEWDKWAKVVYTIMADDYNIAAISTI